MIVKEITFNRLLEARHELDLHEWETTEFCVKEDVIEFSAKRGEYKIIFLATNFAMADRIIVRMPSGEKMRLEWADQLFSFETILQSIQLIMELSSESQNTNQ